MNPDEILGLIESLRSQLVVLAQHKSLIDPEVVTLSQRLDSYLTLYHNLITNFLS
ncbi:Spo0E like sporulation regulatory protein [Desulfosporosinus acidiphilus SJ4]|uniref:Spo0E like sporulation regulatory protein n=1 Tax=Desulfosporosinus acidiphilus (strain DSM 22704 / JCM 16185 / SJ4) TaxID=646529 RepID=I4D5S6_DESAJ|nr:aspartyl-phosphate phosphatase Spo0E family protein [Desulfosporosinus acidiphilus]AFM41150.1 Spo0E like sporulation regulatory protein [Desulfosporosinus acidiphilus SJ4]